MNRRAQRPRDKRGSALLVVLAFLAILAIYAMASAVTLTQLRQELKLVDHQQQAKYATAETTRP